jgi:hypothetical protein
MKRVVWVANAVYQIVRNGATGPLIQHNIAVGGGGRGNPRHTVGIWAVFDETATHQRAIGFSTSVATTG